MEKESDSKNVCLINGGIVIRFADIAVYALSEHSNNFKSVLRGYLPSKIGTSHEEIRTSLCLISSNIPHDKHRLGNIRHYKIE